MWNGVGFTDVATLGPLPADTHLYASKFWRTKNPN
jgi:hypothetical protein